VPVQVSQLTKSAHVTRSILPNSKALRQTPAIDDNNKSFWCYI